MENEDINMMKGHVRVEVSGSVPLTIIGEPEQVVKTIRVLQDTAKRQQAPKIQTKIKTKRTKRPSTRKGLVRRVKVGGNRHKIWTNTEDTLLKNEYGIRKNSAIAKDLGRTTSSVKNRIQTLGLKRKIPNKVSNFGGEGFIQKSRPRMRKAWTNEELIYLKANWHSGTNTKNIADHLNRKESAVKYKAWQVGLKRPRQNQHTWTKVIK